MHQMRPFFFFFISLNVFKFYIVPLDSKHYLCQCLRGVRPNNSDAYMFGAYDSFPPRCLHTLITIILRNYMFYLQVQDLGNLLGLYAEWHSHLLPYYTFDQFVHKVEQVGSSKRVKVYEYLSFYFFLDCLSQGNTF